jgi:hypothetical protein
MTRGFARFVVKKCDKIFTVILLVNRRLQEAYVQIELQASRSEGRNESNTTVFHTEASWRIEIRFGETPD